MQVFVTCTLLRGVFIVDVPPTQSMTAFKQEVSAKTRVPADRIRGFTYQHHVLDDLRDVPHGGTVAMQVATSR